MIWSFLWRAAVYGAATAYLFTWITGFVAGLLGSSHETIREAGQIAQVFGVLFGAYGAYWNAKDAQKPKSA